MMNYVDTQGFSVVEPERPDSRAPAEHIELEQAFLGALLQAEYGQQTRHLVERVTADDFAEDVHRIIFQAIADLSQQDQSPTFRLLAPLLEGIRVTPDLTAVAYLGRLIQIAPAPAFVNDYAKGLRDRAARRQFKQLADMAAACANSLGSDIVQAAANISDRLDTICSTLRGSRQSLADFGRAAAEVLAEMRKGPPPIVHTGLMDIDRVTAGWHRRELGILAARPGMGKSAFLFSAALAGAKNGTSTLIFSKEMPTDMVIKRMLSDLVWSRDSPLPYEHYSRHQLGGHDLDRLESVASRFAELPIFIDDQAGLSMSEIRTRVRRHADKLDALGQRLDLVLIDHLGKVRASDRYAGNKVHETGEKTNAAAVMAKELDVAVVAAHQLNRGVEGRDNKRPTLSDLRDSGDVEQDAEMVAFLYRPAYYLQNREDNHADDDVRRDQLAACANDLEFIIGKQRNGPCVTIDLFIDPGNNVVRDASRMVL